MTGKIEKQGVLNLVLLYTGTGIGLLNTVLRTRALTPEEIGVIGILLGMASIASFLLTLGMPAGILRFYSRFKDDPGGKTAFVLGTIGIVLCLFLLVSSAFWLLRDLIVERYDNSLITAYVDFIYVIFLLSAINSMLNTVLRAEHLSVHGTFIMNFVDHALFCGFLGAMIVFPSLGFDQYFSFFLATYGIRTLLFMAVMYRRVNLGRPDFSSLKGPLFKELLAYNAFMMLSGLAGVMIAAIDKLMVGYFIDVAAAGVYTIVLTFAIVLRMIIAGFSAIAQPIIADLWHNGDTDGIRDIYRSNVDIQLLLGGALMATFVTFGPHILAYLGQAYKGAYWVMLFLCIGEMMNVATGLSGVIISFSNEYRFDFYLRVSLVLLAVITNYMLIPIIGLEGAAIATALSLALYNLGKLLIIKVKFGMWPYSSTTAATLTYSVMFGAGLSAIQYYVEIEHIAAVLFGSLFYCVVYLLVGALVLRLTAATELLNTVVSFSSGVTRDKRQ